MVTFLSYQTPIRLDAAPTEVQMKLGISQVLSLPFAYNAPVIVLDFEVGNKNIIKGRFKDASRPRVFEFEIGDSVSFKPFTWKRTDSDVDPMAWEDFSKGYTYRYDAVKKVRKEKPKCGNTSYNCGKACIGLNKNCKSDPPDKPSQEKIDKVRAMGGEFKQTKSDPTKAQENNKLTPKPPEEVIEPYNRNNAPSNIAKKKVAIKRALKRLGVEVSNDETIEGLESKISKASGFKFSDQEDIYELIKRLQSVGTTDNPMVEPGLVSELKPVQEVKVTGISIDKSFHVRDTLIDKDKFNQLPEDQRKAILELTDQFNKLGYIDARTQIGPSQSARQSQNSRDKIAQTAAKAFQIEARIKSLLRTPEEQAIDKASSELSKLRGELDHARNEMRTMQVLVSHKLNSKRDNSVKRYKQELLLREEELNNLITEKELQIKALKNPLQQKQTPQSQPKSTPNSTGESGKAIAVSTPDKTEVPITDLVKQPPVALKVGKKSVNLTDDLDSYRDLKLTADPVLGWQVINKNGDVLREPPNGNMAPSHRFKKREQAEKFANTVMAQVEKLQKAQLKKEAVTATQKAKDVKKTTSKTRLVSQPQGDLKPEATQSQKAIKVQEVRSQEQESPLVPKEEIVKDAPKLIGDGTHEGMPKNAQEYYDMVTKSGGKITKEEAEGTIKAIEKWGLDSNYVRDVQKAGKSSQAEQYITDYINNSTPYKGELYRGLSIYTENPLDFIKVGQLLDNQGAHASWTSKPEVAEWFADEPDDYRYSVVIKSINNKTGASIRNITEEWQGGFMGMEEVIVPKNAKHIVRSIKEIKKDVFFVEVEEV